MAESIDSLYIRLGLSLSDFETDLVAAERTVNENIRRLSRQSELIRLRAQVEISGLDETADAERILQIRTDALNQQMSLQRDRVRMLTAELQSLTAAHVENAAVTQRAAIRLERERLALSNLEQELSGLNETSGETNGLFGELQNMLPAMPTKLQALGMAFGVVTAGIGAAATATKELLDEFRELQNQSYELNMSFPDTRNFLRQLRLANGDIGDFEGYIRGITDAFVKGEYDDPEFVALRKYGAQITDVTGRLKDFKDITDEVYQAWKQAEAAGEGIEFLQLTGGEAGVRDAIQLFRRYEEAKEDAAKIFKAEIDDEQLHKLDRTMNLVEEQSHELRNALGDIFVPAVQAAAENFFDVLHDGTEYLVENKDALQQWGYTASEIFDTIVNKVGGATDWLAGIAKTPKGTTGNAQVDKTMSAMNWRYQDFNQHTPFGVNTDWDKFNAETKESYGIFGDEVKRAEEKYKAFKGELQDATTVAGKMTQGISALTNAQKQNGDVLSQYGIQRVKEFKDELEDLQIELEFGDNEYQKALAQLDLWQKRELTDKLHVSDEESKAIAELYAAKLQQIEQEHRDKIAEAIQSHFENAAEVEYGMTHTAFEKQLRDIERWEEAQRQKAETAEEVQAIIAESAMKEAQAFESEMDRIKGTLQSLEDKIFEQEHSQYENDLRRAQQERIKLYEEYQDKGILNTDTQALIERYFQNAVGKLNKRAAESRAKGGDYTKAPEGASYFGGNGIMVIGADQIIDDGLIRGQQQTIGLLTDENRIRSMLLPKLDAETREAVERIQSLKEMTATQNDFVQQTKQAANDFQLILGDQIAGIQPTFQGATVGDKTIIQGDQVTQISAEDARKVVEEFKRSQQILSQGLEQPTQELQQFGDKIQDTTSELESLQKLKESAQSAADAQKSLADSTKLFPPEYLKNLADSAQSVSETQLLLTDSTLDLIEAQGKLAKAFENLPKVNPAQETKNNQSTDGFLKLATSTQDVRQAQDLLASSARDANASLRAISDIPPPKQSNEGFIAPKLGFDWDSFSGISQTGLQALSLLYSLGGIAPHPAAKAGAMILGGAIGAGFGFGGYKEDSVHEQFATSNEVDLSALETSLKGIEEKIQGVQKAIQDKATIDFSELTTPLNAIDENTQRILQAMQDEQPRESDQLQELFGTLPNIEEYTKSILLELQDKAAMDLSELVTPLTAIDENVQSVLREMQSVKEMPETPKAEMETYMTPLNQFQTPTVPEGAIDYLTPLNNIDGKIQSVLLEMQSRQPVTLETVVTPLNNIEQVLGNIATALSNQQPPQINISPNNNVNLGGAYVFDNALKQELVNDITSQIVDKITAAVQQATSRSSFGYGS